MKELVLAFIATFVAGGVAGASFLSQVIARRNHWRVDRMPPMDQPADLQESPR